MKNILFPINVQALCVNAKSSSNFVSEEQNFRFLPADGQTHLAPISENIMSQPFYQETPLEAGIHLHWTLPSLITNIVSTEASEDDDQLNDLLIPCAPDRWIITRMVKNRNQIVEHKSWIVESREFMKETDDSVHRYTNIPYKLHDQEDLPYRYLGRRYALEQWKNPLAENLLDKIDILANGQLHFSAFYPNCRTVFGFHDSAEALPEDCEVNYSVVGLYSDEKQDVLRDEHLSKYLESLDEGFRNEILAKIGENEKNCSSIYHGSIHHIQWHNQAYHDAIDEKKLASRLTIGMANTQKEAYALIQAENPKEENIFQLLLEGSLLEVDTLDLNKIEASFFNARFHADSAGAKLELDLEKSSNSNLYQLYKKIEILNQSRNQQKESNRAVSSLQWELFTDWYKFIVASYHANGDQEISDRDGNINYEDLYDKAYNFIDSLLEAYKNKTQKQSLLLSEEIHTQDIVDQPFYTPSDPVIMMEFLQEDNWIFAGNRNKVETKVPIIRFDSELCPCPEEYALSIPEPKNWNGIVPWQILEKIINEASAFTFDVIGGKLPEKYSRITWNNNPWLPLFMEWEMELIPKPKAEDSSIPTDFIKEHYDWRPEQSELIPKHWKLDVDNRFSIKARNIMHNQISKVVKGAFEKINIETLEQEDFQEDKLVLTQELDGFNAALLMRKKTAELDIYDNMYEEDMAQNIANVVKDKNREAPLISTPFNPLRNGIFKISRLRIIDAFGRCTDINLASVKALKTASSLKLSEENIDSIGEENQHFPGYSNFIGHFPPRIAQAARKQFQFDYSSSSEKNATAFTELDKNNLLPVDGWFIINYLDQEITLFDGLGKALRKIYSVHQKVNISSAIGTNEMETIENDSLKLFIAYFENQNEDILNDFIASNRNASEHMSFESKAYSEIQYFASKPMAIHKIKLKFELKDLPAFDLSWDAYSDFLSVFDAGQKPKRPHRGFDKIQIPIHLGNHENEKDGLIGFFKSENSKVNLYSHFAKSDTITKDTTVTIPLSYPKRKDSIIGQEIGPWYDANDIVVIFDPSLSISANSGLLPAENIKLDENYVRFILKHIEYHMFTGAVLTREHSVDLPLPKEAEWQWSWLQRGKDRSWNEAKQVTMPVNNLHEPLVLKEGWLTLKRKDQKK